MGTVFRFLFVFTTERFHKGLEQAHPSPNTATFRVIDYTSFVPTAHET